MDEEEKEEINFRGTSEDHAKQSRVFSLEADDVIDVPGGLVQSELFSDSHDANDDASISLEPQLSSKSSFSEFDVDATDSTDVDVVEPSTSRSAQNQSCHLEKQLSTEEGSPLLSHRKHVFVLTEAGKPVYSRHGSEENFASVVGVIQVLVSFVQTSSGEIGDQLLSIQAKNPACSICFLVRKPLILCSIISNQSDPCDPTIANMELELQYLYSQFVFLLTGDLLQKVMASKPNYDLRQLVTDSSRSLAQLQRGASDDMCFYLDAVRCLPLAAAVRDQVGSVLSNCLSKSKNGPNKVVFSLVLARSQVVMMTHLKDFKLATHDLHLLTNFLESNPSLRYTESWSPICLSHLSTKGYLYAYIVYLEEGCQACLILISNSNAQEEFFNLKYFKSKIVEKLKKLKALNAIETSCSKSFLNCRNTGVADLWHFVYKNIPKKLMISADWIIPYNNKIEKRRLLGRYRHISRHLHLKKQPNANSIHYVGTGEELILGWKTPTFELYASFHPMTSKAAMVSGVDKLIRWIKKEESTLFILNQPVH